VNLKTKEELNLKPNQMDSATRCKVGKKQPMKSQWIYSIRMDSLSTSRKLAAALSECNWVYSHANTLYSFSHFEKWQWKFKII